MTVTWLQACSAPNFAWDAVRLRNDLTSGPSGAPARLAWAFCPAALGVYLLLSEQYPPLTLFLLLSGLGLVPPHAGDIILVPDVPALLRQDVHGAVAVHRLGISYDRREDAPPFCSFLAMDWSWAN